MDNLTHTLAGVLLGESFSRLSAAPSAVPAPTRRRALFVLSVACSNLPDADVIYTAAAGHQLDYLSQHRGYSHTVLGALLGAAIVLLLVELWARSRRFALTRADRGFFAAVVLVALGLHLALDFTNSYGVHPFWPLDGHWIYGDAVFIIEPLLWACAAPLLFVLRSVPARAFIAIVLATALGLSFDTPWVLPASGVALAVLILLLLVVGWKASARIALTCAVGAWLAVTAMFFAESRLAAQRIDREFALRYPRATLVDHVLTPMPVNPLCWSVITVSIDGNQYALRRGVLSTAPDAVSAERCPDRTPAGGSDAAMRRIDAPHAPQMLWLDEYTAGRADLGRFVQAYCDAAILMRFARAPWLARGGPLWSIGDLRYGGFATVELAPQARACTSTMPPWVPPRADLLRAAGTR